MTSLPKQFRAPLVAFFALWVLCLLVSITGGLPEPLATQVGQKLSRLFHVLFLVSSIGWILFSPLAKGESRAFRIATMVLALVAYAIVVETLKHYIYLPRPGQPAVRTPGERGSGFPSGHTVPVFEIACIVAAISPRLTVPALAMAVLIGYSRVEVTAHYAYQVVLSGALGIAVGLSISAFRAKVIANSRQKGVAPSTFS